MHELSNSELEQLIRDAISGNHETDKVEFKKGTNGIGNNVYRSISSFSNTPGGGIIVWGVEEVRSGGRTTFRLINLNNSQEIQEKSYNYIATKMTNVGEHAVKVLTIDQKIVVVLALSELPMESKPCYNTAKGINQGTYIRIGNVDRQATEEEIRSFLRYSPEYKFDQQPQTELTVEDLNIGKVEAYFEASARRTGRTIDTSGSITNVLANKKIIVRQGTNEFPTLAGVLLFSDKLPQLYTDLDRYIVRCVKYEGNSTSSNILDTQDVDGTLDAQVDLTLNFVLRNISKSAKIEGSQRVERYEYPPEALREVIVNAIIHRDYSIKETYVQVAVFSDRIEITNPGVLPPGITIDNLKDSQFSRNTVIAGVMRDLRYMEEFGRGIDLIYSQARDWGLPEPLFKNRSNTFKATILSNKFNRLNERQIKIWGELQYRSSITSSAVRELFPDTSKATVNNDLKILEESNLIRRQGSGVNTYYEANY